MTNFKELDAFSQGFLPTSEIFLMNVRTYSAALCTVEIYSIATYFFDFKQGYVNNSLY